MYDEVQINKVAEVPSITGYANDNNIVMHAYQTIITS